MNALVVSHSPASRIAPYNDVDDDGADAVLWMLSNAAAASIVNCNLKLLLSIQSASRARGDGCCGQRMRASKQASERATGNTHDFRSVSLILLTWQELRPILNRLPRRA